uniref:Cation efflux protein transmembrane domain-containing protein n=1 Tax=Coccidioides posadasii RMSCC 3488 TaxID=454284 RepID=A0A0J6ETC4_COCPO|nr:hypothetical protein CPAG_00105 [Coccidioides posadasii RMSCC 3488]
MNMQVCFGKCRVSTQVRLLIVIAVSFSFVMGEFGVGFKTRSLSLVADAFHYTADIFSFMVAFLAEKYSRRPDENNKRGYARLPTLAAFFNSVVLVAIGLGIFLQGIERFIHLQAISSPLLVFVMGWAGLFLNIICILIMGPHGHHHHHHHHGHGHGHDHPEAGGRSSADADPNRLEPAPGGTQNARTTGTSLSIKAVVLHIGADALNNVAVIISAAIVWRIPSRHEEIDPAHTREAKFYVDPACTVFIAILIMGTTWPLVVRSGKALLRLPESGSVSIPLDERASRTASK